jgi:hypothetical protein
MLLRIGLIAMPAVLSCAAEPLVQASARLASRLWSLVRFPACCGAPFPFDRANP